MLASGLLHGTDVVNEQTPPQETTASVPGKVVVIPIRAQIAKPELYILRRGLKEAIAQNAQGVILDMETPGGAVDVTLEMMEALDRFEGRKLTFVNDEAGSAGAIIASVTDEIYFSPTGVMGAAEMIFGSGQDVGEGLKRKMNSFLGAKIRALSNEQPMRADVIKAMMDPNFEFKVDDVMIKAKDELLTVTAKEAVRAFGDPPVPLLAAGIAETVAEVVEREFGTGTEIIQFQVTWSERLAQFVTTVTPILLGLGLLALFIEFKTPGFGFFGVAGLLMLGTVFLGHYVAGLSGHEPALIFIVGVLFIAIELFFFPGTFVMAITGLAMMFGSLIWAMIDHWPGEPISFQGGELIRPLANLLVGVVLAVLTFLLILKFLPKGGPWGNMVLESSVGDLSRPLQSFKLGGPSSNDEKALIGQRGVAVTSLFPSGQIEIHQTRYEARLAVGFAERGASIKVTGVSEFGLIVEVIS